MLTFLRFQNDITVATFLSKHISLLFYQYRVLHVDFSSMKINLIILNPYVLQLNLLMFYEHSETKLTKCTVIKMKLLY
jgi:subtilase family serine protease